MGNSFNLERVQSLRHYHQIPCFDEAKRDWLTLEEAAERLRVSQATVRKLLERRVLKGRQIVKYAPWMIGMEALNEPSVQAAVASVHSGHAVPPTAEKHYVHMLPVSQENSVIHMLHSRNLTKPPCRSFGKTYRGNMISGRPPNAQPNHP